MKMLACYMVVVSVIMLGFLLAHKADAEEFDIYQYIEVKAGTFANGCYDCENPNGRIPAYLLLGLAAERGNHLYAVEALHHSNWDRGFPGKSAAQEEYYRVGIFLVYRYKFKLQETMKF